MNNKKYYERGKSTYLIHVDSQGFEYIKERGLIAKEFPFAYRCSSCGRFDCCSPQSLCSSCKHGFTKEVHVQRTQEEIVEAREERKKAAAFKRAEKLRKDSQGLAKHIMKKIVMSGDVLETKEQAILRILKEINDLMRELYFSSKVKVNGKVRSALDLVKALHHIRTDKEKVLSLAEILVRDHE